MLSADASSEAHLPKSDMQSAPLSGESWRLLVEAEIDTMVRELRKNSLWAEAAERDGVGALWVGGSRWPGTQHSAPDDENASLATRSDKSTGAQSLLQTPPKSRTDRYRQEIASRRTLGKAGECIGLASFAEGNDDLGGNEYEVGRMMVLESFLLLREAINSVSDPHKMSLQSIVDPFMLVIRDPETTGPITRCALVSVQRFINHGIVDLSSASAVPALLDMAQAVTHCRFEATDAASDEAVLMQILNVLGALVLSDGGHHLNDVTVCEIMETVLSMSCQMRLSEMLRKAAESTLFTLVTFVFGRLNSMQRQDISHEARGQKERKGEKAAPSVSISPASRLLVKSEKAEPSTVDDQVQDKHADVAKPNAESSGPSSEVETSFGLPAIHELYRVLVALTNPQDLQYTDTMRLLALNTLQAAFQKSCYAMAEFASLRELTLGDLSHNLLLILQRDQPALISPALRVLYLLFASHRRDAKGHLELFLCQTLGRVMTLPVVARQGGSRTSLLLGGGLGSRPSTPKIGPQQQPQQQQKSSPKPRAVSGAALGLGESTEKTAAAPAQHGGLGASGGRRPSATSPKMHVDNEAKPPADISIPSVLRDTDGALSYEQEVELYSDASLRLGMRGRLATQETRRQLLEGLHHLLIGDESLMADLWVNYDCDLQSGNMFDFLISFVANRAVPWEGDPESEAFLDVMLHYLIRIAVRAGVEPPTGTLAQLLGLPPHLHSRSLESNGDASVSESAAPASVPLTMAQLQDRRKHKHTMMHAAQLFNEKPKEGIAFLQRVGVLTPDNSTEMAQQLAGFLRTTPMLNKKLLGEYLSKPSNLEVLQTYIGLFDFSGRRLDEALRQLLGAFRLPGESQQIERIVETFAEVYFASDPPDIATKDAAFILAFAVIMLNTDQHSPQVKVRMRYDDFARNLRGVNDGQDFRRGFLEAVYAAIRDHEIVFPEEHEGAAGFEYAWHAISGDAAASPWMSTRGHTSDYDGGLLAATWQRLLQSLADTLGCFTNDHTLRLALSGLYALIGSAAHYGLTACVDECLRLLADTTGLLGSSMMQADLGAAQVLVKSYNRYVIVDPESPTSSLGVAAEGFSGTEQRSKLQEQEQASVQLTQTALGFGGSYRAQIAFVALFEFVARFSPEIGRQGWVAVLDVVRLAVDTDLMPPALRAITDAMLDNMWVPRVSTLQAMDAAQRRISARHSGAADALQGQSSNGGLLSAISSLWGGGSADPSLAGRKQGLRWRASPELLVGLIGQGKKAVQASSVEALGTLADTMGPSLPEFLSVLAQLFPQPPSSPPGSPPESDAHSSSDAQRVPPTTSAAASLADHSAATVGRLYLPSAVYFFEVAVSLVLRSPHSAPSVWASIESSVQRMLEYADVLHQFCVERAVSGVLNMAVCVIEACADHAEGAEPAMLDTVERMLRCLGLLRDVKDPVFDAVAPVLAEGIARLVDADARTLFSVHANWAIVRLLLKRVAHVQDAADTCIGEYNTLRRALSVLVEIVVLLKCGALDPPAYFVDLLDALAAFLPGDRALATQAAADASSPSSHMSGMEAASKLIALLYDMQEIAKAQADAPHSPPPGSSPNMGTRHLPQAQAAQTEPSIASVVSGPPPRHKATPLTMWVGAMGALTGYACLSSREVRQLACSHIQRAVSADLDVEWTATAFNRVLFPLMDMLLRADLLADSSMEDTHARCISMLTMVFLHNAAKLQVASSEQQAASPTLSAISRSPQSNPPSVDREPAVVVADKGRVGSLLCSIWLRLIQILSVYIQTRVMALESPIKEKQSDPRQHGISLDNKAAAERRRHLDVLGEMAEESIKNCMLVLDSMSIFGASADERETNDLWLQSWKRLDEVNPRLRAYIFPSTKREGDCEANVSDVPEAQEGGHDASAAPADQSPQQQEEESAAAGNDKSIPEQMPLPEHSSAQPVSGDTVADSMPETVADLNADTSEHNQQPSSPAPAEPKKKKKHSRQNIIIVP
ncbi:GDP/GTP exchange factor for ARF [Coemansia guatemalensis]|uniref:GDP/GTP exchange factor for ARF n=1 Tax=Coemansia guatemalensis TaxID=2761395 RepID=A0A9W8I2I8_9FUNG|nr:GDP/GTP exchange factor for ARF [Coemansia guatemalensis]